MNNKNEQNITIEQTTCFEQHKNHKVCCNKTKCRNWINLEKFQNCCVITVNEDGQQSLEDIGKIFNLTRMRICQIEKDSKEKIFKTIL